MKNQNIILVCSFEKKNILQNINLHKEYNKIETAMLSTLNLYIYYIYYLR